MRSFRVRVPRGCIDTFATTAALQLVAGLAAIFLSWPEHAHKNAIIQPVNQPVEVVREQRPVYPYSVLAGGAYTASELRAKLKSDEVAARHYQAFQLTALKIVKSHFTSPVYVSYRKGNQIYWTRKPVRLTPDEALLTDGLLYARARCGNRISETAQEPVAETDPPAYSFDVPDSYHFSPVSLPETTQAKVTLAQPAKTAALVPDDPGGWPISPGVGLSIFPRGTSPASPAGPGGPGTSGTPGPGNGGPGTPVIPAIPGSGNSGSGNPGGPGNSNHGNGGSGSQGTPGTPRPGSDGPLDSGTPGGNGAPGDPCCPATPPVPVITAEDPGTPAPPDPIVTGTDDPGTPVIPPSDPGGGWDPSPPPLTPVPEPGSVALLLTAVAAITGIHMRQKRRSGTSKP
jgi:hypothetical protein